MGGFAAGGVSGFGREEADRVVAPEILEGAAGIGIEIVVVQFVEFEDRHELDTVDAQVEEVGNLVDDGGECAGRIDGG